MDRIVVEGERCTVYANQGRRDGRVLALRGGEVLLEYSMPAGTTSLRIVDRADSQLNPDRYLHWQYGANQSYWQLSTAWLEAIVEAGQGWIGRPQQSAVSFRQVPDPDVLLQARKATRETCPPSQQAELAVTLIHQNGQKLDHFMVYYWVRQLYRKQAHSELDIVKYLHEQYGWEMPAKFANVAG